MKNRFKVGDEVMFKSRYFGLLGEIVQVGKNDYYTVLIEGGHAFAFGYELVRFED